MLFILVRPSAGSLLDIGHTSTMNHLRLAQLLAFVAGLLDFGTGLGLTFMPAKILPLMLVPVPSEEALTYLRFVGAFVAAVGASYLWALLRGGVSRLRGVFEFTVLFRFASGLFAACAIARGWLTMSWATVPAADFALIGLQLWLLAKLIATDNSAHRTS